MATKIGTANIAVGRFGYIGDDSGQRLVFPHAEAHGAAGRSGTVGYGADDVVVDELEGRIDTLLWRAAAASVGHAWLRDDAGRVDVRADRIEVPHSVRLVRAEHGIEIVSSHVTLSEVALEVIGPFKRSAPVAASAAPREATRGGVNPAASPPMPSTTTPPRGRESPLSIEAKPPLAERLRFLDSLSGKIGLTLKVQLDLPVLGSRTLDQALEVAISEGSFDFRALDDSLNWLEGQFLDVKHRGDKLAVTWRVPVFGPRHDLISWQLDKDAATIAAFGRVPVRALADYHIGDTEPDDRQGKKPRRILEAFALDAIDVVLSLIAPRRLDIGAGTILFGGDDQPGMVDFQVTGGVADSGAGKLAGRIGSIDTTVKDLRLGPVTLTADRLCFDGLDHLEVTFDGFTPTKLALVAHRVTATNLALRID